MWMHVGETTPARQDRVTPGLGLFLKWRFGKLGNRIVHSDLAVFVDYAQTKAATMNYVKSLDRQRRYGAYAPRRAAVVGVIPVRTGFQTRNTRCASQMSILPMHRNASAWQGFLAANNL
jgi:hypothetical protein